MPSIILQTLSEVLSILDTVCKRDETLLPKVFDNIRRLFGRSTMTNPRIKLQILQFYLNFSKYNSTSTEKFDISKCIVILPIYTYL